MRELNKKYVKKIEEKHFLGPPLLLLCLIISALNNKIVSMSRTKDRFQFLEAQIVDITESGILFLRVDVYHHLYSDHLL